MRPTRGSMLAVAALVVLGACSGDGNGTPTAPGPVPRNTNFRAVEAFAYTLAWGNRPVRLQGINGTVRVTGGSSGSAVTITGEREVRSDSQQDANDQVALLHVEVQDAASEIQVSTRQPSNPDGRSYVVNYVVTMPAAAELDVVNVNGTVDVVDAGGNVSVRVINGRVDASAQVQPGGAVRLTTVNGEIALRLPRDTSAVFSAQVATGRSR